MKRLVFFALLLLSSCATPRSEYYRGCYDGLHSLPNPLDEGISAFCSDLDKRNNPPVHRGGRGGA